MTDEPGTKQDDDLVLPGKVAILYTDVKREYFSSEEIYQSDKDADIPTPARVRWAGH